MVYNSTDIEISTEPRIAVVGVGGAGCNVVTGFFESMCSVDTIAINTDKDALHAASADEKIYICKEVLKGEGAHGDAALGKKCADIHKEEIRDALAGHDFVFVVAGLGGGTGTGAASVVIEAAQSQNILTFAVCIAPFSFEGSRVETARNGYAHIRAVCPHTVLVENDLVLEHMSDLTMNAAFNEVNRSIRKHVMDCVRMVEETYTDELMKPRSVEEQEVSGDTFPLKQLMSA
ncbi:MAG: cell division protein FtsZ [Candidatus Methanomethylophilaceae archaeon]|nr:cell division protein FtsZ [Candidatus Methanomethylophilaceae archaeon]